jgi:hypothetical protein
MLTAAYSMFNRRHFMKHVAGLSLMALPAFRILQGLQAFAQTLKKNNKSLIVLWMSGGPPTIDLWDLKPNAPSQIRGEFKSISTAASGIQICEHLPKVAAQMKHLSIIRSLSTTEGDHQRGRVLMHTAHSPNPIVNYPSMGSLVSSQIGSKELALPAFISIGRPADGPGFLGMNYAPFTVQNPGQPPENIKPPDVLANEDKEKEERIRRRRRLFTAVEDNFTQANHGDAASAHSEIYKKAYKLVASKEGKVFDLKGEKNSLREEYGKNSFGDGCLLARRLVEAGVTCVEVDQGGWDLHQGIFPALKNQRLPALDKGMGALVRDLVDRGLWNNTVVLWLGEFGRTPNINPNAGRDHFPACWSVVVGGGAIKGGIAYGSTSDDGKSVKDKQVNVGDLFATIYKGLGLDPETKIRDNLGRPLKIAEWSPRPGAQADGKPIQELV